MSYILIVENKENAAFFLEKILKAIGFENFEIVSEKEVRENFNIVINSSLIITRNIDILNIDKSLFFYPIRIPMLFVSNLLEDSFVEKVLSRKNKNPLSSYKIRDFKILIESLLYKENDLEKMSLEMICGEKEKKVEKMVIQDDITNIQEKALDFVLGSFDREKNTDVIDRDKIIISLSEVLDNAIEAVIDIGQTKAKIELTIISTDEVFAFGVEDIVGTASIYSISKSLSRELSSISINKYTNSTVEISEISYLASRGRGYNLIKKTSDRIIVIIQPKMSVRKYNTESPKTLVFVIYYKMKKKDTYDESDRLNCVLEFC